MDIMLIIVIVIFCLVIWVVLYFMIKSITHTVNPSPYEHEELKEEWIKVIGKITKKWLSSNIDNPRGARYLVYNFEFTRNKHTYKYKFIETGILMYLNIKDALHHSAKEFMVGDKIEFYVDPKDYSKYYIDPKELLK